MQRGAEARGIRARLANMLAGLPRADLLPGLTSEVYGDASVSAARWNPGRRGALGMVLVASLSLCGAGAWVLAAQPDRLAAVSAQPSSVVAVSAGGSLASPIARPSPAGTEMVVDVVGNVREPGVYRLPSGARVNDAIAAAGGVGRGVDLTGINLARKLTDGEQIAIGVPGAGPPGGSAGGVGAASGAASGAVGGLVELNSATLAQLDGLPGVGPVLAQHIVDWRSAHGRFDSVEQLKNVSGIGDAKFADLKPLVTVA